VTTVVKLTVLVGVLVVVGAGLLYGESFQERFERNQACCRIPAGRNVLVTLEELLGVEEFPSEIGQDKWVLETMFPGVGDGYFVDVGSAHGRLASNTWALERHGWTGLCIDPFPIHMEGRTCRLFKEVVFSDPPRRMKFQSAGGLGGVADTLGKWNEVAAKAPTVEFTTTTLTDILARAKAPAFVHFVSLDIEGAELEALKAFPFETVRVGAWAIEHNREEPKRTRIAELLRRHGYVRVHTYEQDDFYAPASTAR
jgi:hypothetical protein